MGRSNAVVDNDCCNCTEDLLRYIGQTVTIFTKSGGLSGSGFTGVLISIDCKCIRLLTSIGLPPACPVGSACSGDEFVDGFGRGNWGGRFGSGNGFDFCGGGFGDGFCGNPFGSLCVIPTASIVSYTVPVI